VAYVINGYQPKVPKELIIAVQNGDYAVRSEVLFENEVVMEYWVYLGVIKI
jgi:hypothetical protein